MLKVSGVDINTSKVVTGWYFQHFDKSYIIPENNLPDGVEYIINVYNGFYGYKATNLIVFEIDPKTVRAKDPIMECINCRKIINVEDAEKMEKYGVDLFCDNLCVYNYSHQNYPYY